MRHAKFASGKHARAMCDICGCEVPYRSLRLQWDGLRVCPEDYSPKHPQLEPRVWVDAQMLQHPRPDNDGGDDAIAQIETLFPNTAGGSS